MPSSPKATPSDEKTQDSTVGNIELLNVKTTTTARETAGQEGGEIKERSVAVTTAVANS